MKVALILACAGKGERAGFGKNKLLVPFNNTTCIEQTYNAFKNSGKIDNTYITVSAEDYDVIKNLFPDAKIVLGGKSRTESVLNALDLVNEDIVLIHDGARPFVTQKIIEDAILSAQNHGGAIPVIPSPDTVISSNDGQVKDYLGKSEIYLVQTPQAFKTKLIKEAYAHTGMRAYNDDGEVFKSYFGKLHVFNGDAVNVKLTFKEDFHREDIRFGVGFDCHKLVENRKLILGGVEIPHDKGLLGHSDADVLTHAVMDAILSACALRDIGYHFSDKDPKYKDANSLNLLQKVMDMVSQKGYIVKSVSATIMAEKPKLLNHIPSITKSLANALDLPVEKVGVSATTLEGLGFVGREEGICTHATAVLTTK